MWRNKAQVFINPFYSILFQGERKINTKGKVGNFTSPHFDQVFRMGLLFYFKCSGLVEKEKYSYAEVNTNNSL